MINDPAKMAKTMPGVESFEIADDTPLVGQGEGAARARRPEDVDRVHEARGAGARVRVAQREGSGRRRADEHDDVLHPLGRGREDVDEVGGGRQDRRPRRLDGPARAPADRQPAGRERDGRARGSRCRRRQPARRRYAVSASSASRALCALPPRRGCPCARSARVPARARRLRRRACHRAGAPRRGRRTRRLGR